jgi:hypothetical protein
VIDDGPIYPNALEKIVKFSMLWSWEMKTLMMSMIISFTFADNARLMIIKNKI